MLVVAAVAVGDACARGVSPYLPLNLDPDIERQVEQVLILGDQPVMTRPIAAATVLDALPKACVIDADLCGRVREFLKRYMHSSGVEFASLEGAFGGGAGDRTVIPNQHGRAEDSHYQAAAAGYWQPSDYALVNLGGVAYQGRATPTGSLLSLGFDWAQLDLGYRDHWWSPMTDSAMLISTEAPTMPSITLSNYKPLSRLGFQYEIFAARMSRSNRIQLTDGTYTTGYPKFAGLHLGIEPASGWSLAASRVLIFGGGAAGGQSVGDVLDAFFNPSKAQSTGFGTNRANVGKQEASLSSRFLFPGPMPFALYFEYAANDTSLGKNYLFGKPALSAGIHLPRVGPFDLTYEISDWEVTWYVHGYSAVQTGYGDGITNYGRNIGHWFGDQRQFGDAVGGQSNMLRVGWEPRFGGRLEAQFRYLKNLAYSPVPYRHEYMTSVSYSYPWRDYAVGAEIDEGRDVFGQHYTRLAGYLRYGDALPRVGADSGDGSSGLKRPDGAEVFVDAGVNGSRVLIDLTALTPRYQAPTSFGPHLGFGARRAVSENQDLGVRVEADEIRSHALLSVRAIDYRYRFYGPFAWNAFLGAGRYAVATPAYGWYFGTGLQWRNALPGWDIGADYRVGYKLARQRSLATDPQRGYRPDAFYSVDSVSLYVSRKF
jgi:hypothetical protein